MFDDKAQANPGNQNLNPSPSSSPAPVPSAPVPPASAPLPGGEPDDIFDSVEDSEVGSRKSEVGVGGEQPVQPLSAPAGVPAQPQPVAGPPPPGSVAVPQIETDKIQTMPPEQQPATDPSTRSEKKSLSGGKKILIIAVSIVLVIALAGGGYWLYGKLNRPLGAVNDANVTNVTNITNEGGEPFDQTQGLREGLMGREGLEGEGADEAEPEETPPPVQEPELPIDTDGDGLTDDEELALGTNLNEPDSDRDGLPDKDEVEVYKTNPLNPDTDGDGYVDGDEVANGYDPRGEGRLLETP